MTGKWIDEHELNKLEHAKRSAAFTDAQRAAVAHVDRQLVLKGCRPATRTRYASKAKFLALFLGKPFEDATRADLSAFLSKVSETYDPENMRNVKSWLRRFYMFLLRPYDEKLPKVVSWVRVTRARASHRKPKPVFKPEEIAQLLRASGSTRDRAVFSMLYESGARVSELCGLSIEDVEFDEYGARALMDGKTGARKVRLIQSVPDLKDWLNEHPWRHDRKSPLFVDPRKEKPEPLLPEPLRKMLLRTARRAGFEKHANPHAFRRSRATELSQHLTPSELAVYHGWVQGSRMPQIYIHLSGDDVEKKLLRRAGIIEQDTTADNPLQPLVCESCATPNSAVKGFCGKCGSILRTPDAGALARERDELLEQTPKLLKLFDDPEVSALLLRKLRDLQNEGEGASQMPNARRALGQRNEKNLLVSRGSSAPRDSSSP